MSAARQRVRGPRGNIRAGALALGAIAVAVWLIFAGLPFGGDPEFRAVFADANGVRAGSAVRIAGVEVGEVTGVTRGPGTAATVTFAVRPDALPLRHDATIKIRPRTFLEGNFFLDVRPGSPGAPELGERDVIPLGQTATPVQFDQVLSALRKPTRVSLQSLLHEYRTALGGGGAEALAGAAPPMRRALRANADVAEALRGTEEGDLPGLVSDGGRTAAALTPGAGRLAELVTGLNRSMRGMASTDRRLAQTTLELDRLVREAPRALDDIDGVVPPARRLLDGLRPALAEAPSTLRSGTRLLEQVRALLSPRELPTLRRHLQPAVVALADVAPPAAQMLRHLTPVSECARRNIIPTLNQPVEDPPHSTGQPVYRDMLSGLVGLGGASQSFDGNGPALRYHVGAGDQTLATGDLPNSDQVIVGLTEEPIIGSRPRFTGKLPPFRPDEPCSGQQPPDLRAETGPAPRQESVRGGRR
jgi:phospholipid/cholesterol/gamma-HCH transport system substrate-binding protein